MPRMSTHQLRLAYAQARATLARRVERIRSMPVSMKHTVLSALALLALAGCNDPVRPVDVCSDASLPTSRSRPGPERLLPPPGLERPLSVHREASPSAPARTCSSARPQHGRAPAGAAIRL